VKQALDRMLVDLQAAVDEEDEYPALVVQGCRDALLGTGKPLLTGAGLGDAEMKDEAWSDGYRVGKKHKEALSS
jgi:hypothetical protein